MSKHPLSSMIPGNQPFTSERFNRENPVVKVRKYKNGLELQRESTTKKGNVNRGKKSKIKGLSKRSLDRLAFWVTNSPTTFHSIITLTYGSPIPTQGNIIKRHLKSFLAGMSLRFGSYGYVWWLEFQTKRQAPHFHIIVTLPGPSEQDRIAMGRLWANIVYAKTEGMMKEYEKVFKVHSFTPKPRSNRKPAWEAIRKIDGAKAYIIKYAKKHEQKDVPKQFSNVGRFWGIGGKVEAGKFFESDITENEVREYLAERGLSVANSEILPKLINIPK